MKSVMYLFGALAFAAAANAAVITCSFNNPVGDIGVSNVYTCGGLNITATAFGGGHLFGKNDGGDEIGVGLTTDSTGEHEITPGTFIQLDLVNILGNNPMSLIINSDTVLDRATIYSTGTAGAMTGGSALFSLIASEGANTFSPTLRYLDVTATAGNVLLGPLTFTVTPTGTPEPASLGLVGCGLFALGLIRRRVSPRA